MPRDPRYAVFFKTYAWDAFIERQARRCLSSIRHGDFFVSVDETNGPIPSIPFPYVIRTSSSALQTMGYANRSERGALFWWNADYPHYQILDLYPEYEYFVFQEYDVTLKGSIDELVHSIATTGADFVALPVREDKQSWAWTGPHLPTYSLEQMEGCLMSLSVFSKRALAMLARRRLEMSGRTDVAFWPSAEVFLPTEIRAAGYRYSSLAQFVDTSHYDWRPPSLESEVDSAPEKGLFHPVYDRRRFTRWALGEAKSTRDFFRPQSPLRQALRRVPLGYRVMAYFSGLSKSLSAAFRNRLVFNSPHDKGN